VDKTIDIRRRDDRVEFCEHGSEERRTTVVVGQTIRWQNNDARPHRLVSVAEIGGKPLFDTGVIGPGEHSDMLVDIELYSRAGGKPANLVSVDYYSTDDADARGELQILSAARHSGAPWA
jgi:hypothetical protein